MYPVMLQHYINSVKKLYIYVKQITTTNITYHNDHDSLVMRFLCFI